MHLADFELVETIEIGEWRVQVSVAQMLSQLMVIIYHKHSSETHFQIFTKQREAVYWIESVIGMPIA